MRSARPASSGFPGETEEDLARLLDLLEEVQFERVGVFAYSAQGGTRANELADDVPAPLKRERLERVTEHQRLITAERYETRVGHRAYAIVDRPSEGRSADRAAGRSPSDGVRARLAWQADDIDGITYLDRADVAPGTIVEVDVTAVVDDYDFTATVRRIESAPGPGSARPRAKASSAGRDGRTVDGVLRPMTKLVPARSLGISTPPTDEPAPAPPVSPRVDGPRSAALMARARAVLPGGVNSPVRAFGGVGGEPFVVERGSGARIWDVDGREYIDYVLSWGPLILGHAAPAVLDALQGVMRWGTSFGIPTELEVRLAEAVRERMPHLEMIRFVSSGTEATMSAIRLARAHTGRDRVLKFDGCYHGHADSFLVQAGSGVATLGLPNSPGVPAAVAALTLTAPFNDLDVAARVARQHAAELAAIIVEPVVGNAGFIAPDAAFLPGLRALADELGALLIFDEVMTGFRIAPGRCARAVRRDRGPDGSWGR